MKDSRHVGDEQMPTEKYIPARTVMPALAAAEDARSNALQSNPKMRREEKPFDLAVRARSFHCRSVVRNTGVEI
jgi:hypothetical protein